jgi:hypothetical protein
MATKYIDPVNGLDTNDGSSWALAYKTLKHAFAAGDTINVAKSAETAAAGTVTATQGSVTVHTTDDLSGVIAQFTVVRISGDDTLYMVKAITTTDITLYRPYRGVSGAGKGLTYFSGLPISLSDDWKPAAAMPGTQAAPITLRAGINTGTDAQDGFTIIYGNNNNYGLNGTNTLAWSWVNISRLAMLYWKYPWSATMISGTITNCFAFRAAYDFGYGGFWKNVTVNGLVTEEALFPEYIPLYDCVINDLETAQDDGNGGLNIYNDIVDTIFKNWRNAGYADSPALILDSGNVVNTRIIDGVFDELGSGCANIYAEASLTVDLAIDNPTFGPGNVFSIHANANFVGKIRINNVNGIPTDQRTYFGHSEYSSSPGMDLGKYTLLSYDASVFRFAAPSAKISCFGSTLHTYIPFFVDCEAGVQKTISVYFRKNASYGAAGADGVTLPTIRFRWMTGTPGALVSNVHEEVMADVDDSWQQVSYTVTPSVKVAILVELVFKSVNAGAEAWFDDFGVS